jgi:hypothetical protein
MRMTTLRSLLAPCLLTRLHAQTCVTFAGAQIVPYNGSSVTGLAQQPNGSYTAIIGTISPPYKILNVVPNFDQWIGSCASPPVALTFPSVSMASTPVGTDRGIRQLQRSSAARCGDYSHRLAAAYG